MNSENLTILADYLASLPKDYDKFDMGVFFRVKYDHDVDEVEAGESMNHCGTAMCALGHGPQAGLVPLDDEDWSDYAKRLFGETWHSSRMQWCFSGSWDCWYPTLDHAVARIRYMAKHDAVPEGFAPGIGEYDCNFANFKVVPV